MAFKHGRLARVYFDGLDISSYLNSAGLSATQATSDTSTFGSTWTSAIAGLSSATLSTGGFYDPELTALDTALGVDSGVVTYCPGGATAVGDMARMMLVTASSYQRSSPVGDVVGFTWDVLAQRSLVIGYLLHPLAEDTNTTTGSSKNDGAATTTGWTAHLHVTLVDGGSWVVKLEDSADNSSWSDVTGGAFTAATGATAQRLSSASGATLRRYVRYTATRTGGSVGNGITFALAYSRSNP